MIEALLKRRSILVREPQMILRETIRRRRAKDRVAKDTSSGASNCLRALDCVTGRSSKIALRFSNSHNRLEAERVTKSVTLSLTRAVA